MLLPSRHTTHNHFDNRTPQERREDKAQNQRIAVGGVAMIVAGVVSYMLGKEIKKLSIADEGYQASHDLLTSSSHSYRYQEWGQKANQGIALFSLVRNRAIASTVIKTTLLAGSLLALSGAFLASSPLMVAGGMVGSAALFAGLIHWGYTSGDTAKIQSLAQRLRAAPAVVEEPEAYGPYVDGQPPYPIYASPPHVMADGSVYI